MPKKGERKPYSWKQPWEREPSEKQWTVRGYRCCAVRGALGSWMLYLAVPKAHPWWGKHYDEVRADVHGGLTFSGSRIPMKPDAYDGGRIVWWLGCDFAHAYDLVPRLVERYPLLRAGSTYRDLRYVSEEAERLVKQAENAEQEQAALNE